MLLLLVNFGQARSFVSCVLVAGQNFGGNEDFVSRLTLMGSKETMASGFKLKLFTDLGIICISSLSTLFVQRPLKVVVMTCMSSRMPFWGTLL